jgi:hypothetical protein
VTPLDHGDASLRDETPNVTFAHTEELSELFDIEQP